MFRAFAAALLLLLASAAHALIPLGEEYAYYSEYSSGWFSTRADACADAAAVWTSHYGATTGEYNPADLSCYVRNAGGGKGLAGASRPGQCPANSVPSGGGCACSEGFTESGNTCVPKPDQTCEFGKTIKSGYFDIGTDPAASPLTLVCSNGCSGLFFGDVPAGSSIVGGVKHWYAKGSYQMSGGTCSAGEAGTPGVPNSSPTVPPDSCASSQNQGTVVKDGKTQTVCIDKLPETASEAGKPAATNEVNKATGSTTTVNITNNSNGGTTVTTTTTTNNGNGTTTKETKTETKDSAGNTTGSTTTKETTGKQTDQQQQQSKCQENPSAEGCGGNAKDVSGSTLYTPKDKTAASVLTAAKDTIAGSGLGSAMGSFFSVGGGGSCTGIHGSITVFDRAMSLDNDVFCSSFAANAFALIRAVLLVLAAWWAFRIAVE